MDCKEVIDSMDKYFEKRLTDLEVHNIKKHLGKCKECSSEYEIMSNLLHALNTHEIVVPPIGFTDKVMKKINGFDNSVIFKHIAIRSWGASLVAAGIIAILLNFTSISFNINDFTGYIYRGSIEINQKVVSPIMRMTEGFKHLTNFFNIESLHNVD